MNQGGWVRGPVITFSNLCNETVPNSFVSIKLIWLKFVNGFNIFNVFSVERLFLYIRNSHTTEMPFFFEGAESVNYR